MKHVLEDGRELVASYDDVQDFFDGNKIIGRVIKDIRPAALDYMIQNLSEIDDIWNRRTECGIQTDDRICIIFSDGDSIEIEFSGDGPILLGFNTANFDQYPNPDGSCYTLHTMFQYCLGYEIMNVSFDRSDKRMIFPAYRGIDMSGDDDGIKEIRFNLRGGTSLIASGIIDYFYFEYTMDFGGSVRVPMKELLAELNTETLKEQLLLKQEQNENDDVERMAPLNSPKT